MKNKRIEEFLIALSSANLLFILSWRKLIYPSSESYHIKLEPHSADYLGIIISVLLTTIIFGGGLNLLRLVNKGVVPLFAKFIFLGIFAVILNGIRLQFFESDSSLWLKIGFFGIVGTIIILILLKWRDKIFPLARTSILLLSPFVITTFSQAILGVFTANPKPEPSIETQLSKIKPSEKLNLKNRVIWIVFDELDYFVPFEMSPKKVDLPEFERLKSTSLFATNAKSPAYETINSMPSLITGKKVTKSKIENKNELLLNLEGEDKASKFSELPNIFSKVKSLNAETAIVGWYHSYCRTIGKDLSACEWETFDTINDFAQQPLSRIIIKNFANCLISLPFGFRIFQQIDGRLNENVEDKGYVERHFRMMDSAHQTIKNTNIDLALIHLPFPHPPNNYDSQTGEFSSNKSYLDNLILTDKVLGELRKTLEDNNLWADSTIIVSSDHQWRIDSYRGWLPKSELDIVIGKEDARIPFFVKLKGQNEPAIYEKPFNTVITADLILAIMKGEVSKIDEVTEWLDKNSDR